jgi:hypothetical protein
MPQQNPRQATTYRPTDDALTALVWQSLSRAASTQRSKAPSPAPSIRAATSPSHPLYPGSISNNAFSHLTLHETRQRPSRHHRIAPTKRRAVGPPNFRPARLDARVRDITAFRAENKSTVTMGARLNLDSDLMVSSWT